LFFRNFRQVRAAANLAIVSLYLPCRYHDSFYDLRLFSGAAFAFRVMAFNPVAAFNTNVTLGSDGYNVYSPMDVTEGDGKRNH
jgi:hypothetical protein